MEKKTGKLLAVAAATVAAGVAIKKAQDQKQDRARRQKNAIERAVIKHRDYGDRKAYFVGGGLASMAGAAYLIRDCAFPGEQITIFEGMHILGGSNDGIGTSQGGFVCRGGRMLNEETYENFWELFSSIPSLRQPSKSVTQEILDFDHAHPTHAKARLVDASGKILDVTSMGFHQADRNALLKLLLTDEKKLDDLTIQEWFSKTPHFFETNFWYMWQTTFAFQKWSSLLEFRRYMNRMIFEFSRIETLEGVTRTPLNQYDSVIRPLEQYLRNHGVHFDENAQVTDIDFAEKPGITAQAIHIRRVEVDDEVIHLNPDDICIVTNGCMTDSATLGSLHRAAPAPKRESMSAELWAKLAAKKPELGDPTPFFGKEEETNWLSFTVTCRGDEILRTIEEFTGNVPGSGALMTFKDSPWLMSSVVAAQPHFENQTANETIFWGYGLYTQAEGEYVKKPMKECTGEEILIEYLHQLHLPQETIERLLETVINVIPCYMPYITAQFQPRKMADRPKVVPDGSVNFAMASQFVEIAQDMVFTEEYSVRAARIAVYQLMDVHLSVCPVTPYNKDPKVLLRALKKAYA